MKSIEQPDNDSRVEQPSTDRSDRQVLFVGVVAALALAVLTTQLVKEGIATNRATDAFAHALPSFVAANGFAYVDVNHNSPLRGVPGWGADGKRVNEVPIKLQMQPDCVLDDVMVHYSGTPDAPTGVTEYSIATYAGGVITKGYEWTRHADATFITGGTPVTYTFHDAAEFKQKVLGDVSCAEFADRTNRLDTAIVRN
jgi:hypothetical protein